MIHPDRIAVENPSQAKSDPAPRAQARPGPATEAGKAASRRNALKHGMTGAGIALPHEDEEGFILALDGFTRRFDPQDDVEAALVRRAAVASSRLDRLAVLEAAAVAPKVRAARATFERTRMTAVLALGRRLTDDPIDRDAVECEDEWDPADPCWDRWKADEPLLIVMELKETYQGTCWLIDRWKELKRTLESEEFLHYENKFKLIRYLGKRPEALLEDELVGEIILACDAIHPQPREFLDELYQATMIAPNRVLFHQRVELLQGRQGEDAGARQEWLWGLIVGELAQLEAHAALLAPLAALEREEAEMRAAFDDSQEGVLRRRYETTAGRELHRALADLRKLQESRPEPPEPEPEPEPEADTPAVAADPASAPARNERPAKPPAPNEPRRIDLAHPPIAAPHPAGPPARPALAPAAAEEIKNL